MIKEANKSGKNKIDPSLSKKYKGTILFKDKYDWAINYVKNRDIEKEINAALEKDKIKLKASSNF